MRPPREGAARAPGIDVEVVDASTFSPKASPPQALHLDWKTGSRELDAYLSTAVPEIVRQGAPHFAGKPAERRLDLAREQIDQLTPVASQLSQQLNGRAFACGSQCASCCIFCKSIAVLRVELRRILDLVERDGRLEEVKRRADQRRDRGKGACPLLSRDGRCTVYAERPLVCRGYHSLDRQDCRDNAKGRSDGIPHFPPMVAARHAVVTLAAWDNDTVNLLEALPDAVAGRLKQAQKRQRRARRSA